MTLFLAHWSTFWVFSFTPIIILIFQLHEVGLVLPLLLVSCWLVVIGSTDMYSKSMIGSVLQWMLVCFCGKVEVNRTHPTILWLSCNPHDFIWAQEASSLEEDFKKCSWLHHGEIRTWYSASMLTQNWHENEASSAQLRPYPYNHRNQAMDISHGNKWDFTYMQWQTGSGIISI